MIGCTCQVCHSQDPRDCRFRSAGLITAADGTKLLIDCGPEFRLQALRAGIDALDAVLITHSHADHTDGIDDLQGITQHLRQALPVYAQASTLNLVRSRYSYIDELKCRPDGGVRWSVPQLEWHNAEEGIRVNGITVVPLPLYHGCTRTLGYRIGNLAYICDCSRIPEETYPLLEGVTDVVIDALRWRSHPTHFNIFQAEREIARIGADRGWLTHLTHDILYSRDQLLMKPGNTLAYDGLQFSFQI